MVDQLKQCVIESLILAMPHHLVLYTIRLADYKLQYFFHKHPTTRFYLSFPILVLSVGQKASLTNPLYVM